MAEKQTLIDFEEADFAGLVAEFRPGNAGGVREVMLRDCLMAVWKLAKGRPCWAGQATIAAKIGELRSARADRPLLRALGVEPEDRSEDEVSERHVRRALGVLEELGVLASYRAKPVGSYKRKTLDHYVVVWTELADQGRRSRGGRAAVTKPLPTRATPATRPGQQGERELAVTRPLPTRATPATRPGQGTEETDAAMIDPAPWPVDPAPWPVDPAPWPVDPNSCPVDFSYTSFPRNGRYGVIRRIQETTTNLLPESGCGSTGQTDWAAVEDFLRLEAGLGTARQRTEELRGQGLDAEESLRLVQQLAAIAYHEINRDRFHKGPAAGIAYRLMYGSWPAAIEENLQEADAQCQSRRETGDSGRCVQLWHRAWRRVRDATPEGQMVDDRRVVDQAVTDGVPRDWALREAGLLPER